MKSDDGYEAIIFDLDGVITRTETIHARAWKEMFDQYRKERISGGKEGFEPFDIETDYPRYVDGVPRYDGVTRFLESRSIRLPHGEPGDDPRRETICGLGNRKNGIFLDQVRQGGVEPYEDAVDRIRAWREKGLKIGLISASRNAGDILAAAGLSDLFDTRVDGEVAARRGLAGKPAPDVFLEAARELGVAPRRAAACEDAGAGVKAARDGEFGLVIGVDRSGRQESMLREAGADLVVSDLSEVVLPSGVEGPPPALSSRDAIRRLMGRRTPMLFLDYDGTLTPIVSRPEDARLTEERRDILRRLANRCRVAIVSGRDREDVADLVGLESVIDAGSHGFDISGPDGLRRQHEDGKAALPELDRAERELRAGPGSRRGVLVERKRFGVAVHLRNVPASDRAGVERSVDAIADEHRALARHGGKMVVELRPDVEWDKGKAVDWLLESIAGTRADVVPFYIGDDVTDEDAFAAVAGDGIGIRVDDRASKQTLARYRLRDPSEVGRFLQWLDELLGGGSS